MRPAAAFLCALILGLDLAAHPEIEEGLARLNALIKEAPADAELYLARGDLYARHAEWVAAEANYQVAAELAPHHAGIARARGALALATGNAREAGPLLDAAVAALPEDPTTRVFRARARALLGDRAGAVADFNVALSLVLQPSAELYLERAAALDGPAAIQSLDEGLARIGPAVALQVRAVELEEKLGRVDAAARRLERIAAQSERRELWHKLRGDLLARAGRKPEAQRAYASAAEALAALPEWLRESPECVRLAAELARLAAANR